MTNGDSCAFLGGRGGGGGEKFSDLLSDGESRFVTEKACIQDYLKDKDRGSCLRDGIP